VIVRNGAPFGKTKYLAARGIRQRFGLKNALEYFIGEKFALLVGISAEEPVVEAELGRMIRDIKRLFSPEEIVGYLYRAVCCCYSLLPDRERTGQ
jgi:hypothetical protein